MSICYKNRTRRSGGRRSEVVRSRSYYFCVPSFLSIPSPKIFFYVFFLFVSELVRLLVVVAYVCVLSIYILSYSFLF